MVLPHPGATFAERYLILSVLGEGGFGTVYSATDLTTHLPVALKILKPEAGGYDRPTRLRFDREVKIVERLRDPHTVRVYAYGEADGLLFAAFENVAGQDLSELLAARGRLEPPEVAHVLRQLLGSLHEAHTLGLLHRDLKPENIRVFRHGEDPLFVKLLDFGLARSTDDGHPSATKTGEIVGTPRYMSPEQLRGVPLSAASDVYSVGLMAFELLLGKEALPGYSMLDQLDRMLTAELDNLPQADRAGFLLPILRRMTAREVEARYGSAGAALSALESVLAGGPPEPEPRRTGSMEVARRETSPSRPLMIAGGIAVALVVALALFNVFSTEETSVKPAPDARNLPSIVKGARPTQERVVSAPDIGTPDAGRGVQPFTDAGLPSYASAGCGKPAARASKRQARRLVYLPEHYDENTPHPLVILIHHKRNSPEDLLRASGFERVADEGGFVILAPEDAGDGWVHWGDDLIWLRAVHDDVAATLCLDTRRTFVVSDGYGGRLATPLICEPWVAAVAVNSQLFENVGRDWLCPERAVPAMWITPMKSVKMPADGSKPCKGRKFTSIAELEELWKVRNHCRGPKQPAGEHCFTWDCETAFRSCRLNGGFGWPNGDGHSADFLLCPKETPTVVYPAAERIWEFFAAVPVE